MNFNRTEFYHPWSLIQMGIAYGENNLKEFISVNDYLDSSPDIDDFFYGALIGQKEREKRLEEERKRRERAESKKGNLPSIDANEIMKDLGKGG